uniref:Uncharacterized protein n=1 Tax=Romanomermis culicivorax TaxID=13658 RepID=A0A915I2L0_ROMCU
MSQIWRFVPKCSRGQVSSVNLRGNLNQVTPHEATLHQHYISEVMYIFVFMSAECQQHGLEIGKRLTHCPLRPIHK